MIEWLSSNNITHDPTVTKAELLHLVKQNKDKEIYIIDEIARAHGHEILRLPPYHCQLNPIELIWAQIKNEVRKKNSNSNQSLKNVEDIVKTAIARVTAEDWKKCIEHTRKVEEEYRRKDLAKDHVYEQFLINLEEESSDDMEFEDETDE